MALNRVWTLLHRAWAVWLALCVAVVMALTHMLSHALLWSQGEGHP
jgi:hypothetical protein